MKKFYFITITFAIYFFAIANIYAKELNHFNKGLKLFNKKEFEKSKIFFERDLVFNPKNEKSYLYLAKIFNKKKNTSLEEQNLNTVILLNPKNEEAIYQLALLNYNRSDFLKTKDHLKSLEKICKKFCIKKDELKIKLNNSSK